MPILEIAVIVLLGGAAIYVTLRFGRLAGAVSALLGGTLIVLRYLQYAATNAKLKADLRKERENVVSLNTARRAGDAKRTELAVNPDKLREHDPFERP